MRHTPEQLLDIIYQYYPCGISQDDPSWRATQETRRLVDARRRAGAERTRWLAILVRLQEKWPDCNVHDDSVHLISGSSDACYAAMLVLPEGPDMEAHRLGFMMSILVPYYVIYSYRSFRLDTKTLDGRPPATRLEPDAAEQPFWNSIAQETEATYQCDRMPVEVGQAKVPDVMAGNLPMGAAMIYDCLFAHYPRLISQDDHFGLLFQRALAEMVGQGET